MKFLGLFFSFLIGFHLLHTQRMEVKIYPDSIRLGEPVVMVWTLSYPDSGYLLLSKPTFVDTGRFLKSLYLFPQQKEKKKGFFQIIQKQVISAYDSGNFLLPFQPAIFLKGKDTMEIFPDSIFLYATYVPIDTTKPIKDIKDIVHSDKKPSETQKKSLIWWIIGAILLLIAALLVYFLFFRKRKETSFEDLSYLKPWERALYRLKKIKEDTLWFKYEPKEFYTELVDILRKYLVEEFNIDAEEMISSEIIEALNRQRFDSSMITLVSELLMIADLAKFANEKINVSTMEFHVHQAILFVEKTHKVEEEKEDARNS
ncbi:MAG: hypothetical protein N2Z72_04955 [Bacteroidales bacterium]|nr:hypothetical protein [Bacteroidales bacterium]